MKNIPYFLLMFFYIVGCKKPEIPKITSTNILQLNLTKDSIVADNYSLAEISAKVDSTIVDTTNTVTFTTDLGVFTNGQTTFPTSFNLHGIAYAYLKSPSQQIGHVKATVGSNYSQILNVQFVTAWPDTLYINVAATATNNLTNRIDVSAQLVKYFGTVSPNLIVNFSAKDTLGKDKGIFTNVKPSDSSGNAAAQFWLQDTLYKGFVFISGKITTNNNYSLQSSNRILFTK